jgi:hypothetical protein
LPYVINSRRSADACYGVDALIMPILKNSKHEKFCQLIAKGSSQTEAYIAVGYSATGAKANASRLIANDNLRVRIEEIQARISESLVAQSIAIKEARIKALNDRWLKLQQVIAERAVDPSMQGIAGGSTGLLAHDQKGVGAGPAAEVIDVYEVDCGVLKELREHEVQAAKELGQWVEKGEISSDGIGLFVIEGCQDAEWLKNLKQKSD